jgi:hypothetical protein
VLTNTPVADPKGRISSVTVEPRQHGRIVNSMRNDPRRRPSWQCRNDCRNSLDTVSRHLSGGEGRPTLG